MALCGTFRNTTLTKICMFPSPLPMVVAIWPWPMVMAFTHALEPSPGRINMLSSPLPRTHKYAFVTGRPVRLTLPAMVNADKAFLMRIIRIRNALSALTMTGNGPPPPGRPVHAHG